MGYDLDRIISRGQVRKAQKERYSRYMTEEKSKKATTLEEWIELGAMFSAAPKFIYDMKQASGLSWSKWYQSLKV